MADRITVCRFFHKASRALLGDGGSVEVIGWTAEQSRAGVELDELGKEENAVARLAYVVHSTPEVAVERLSEIKAGLGFVPERSEFETFEKDDVIKRGAREDWFDVFDGTYQLFGFIFVLFPESEETRDEFRRGSIEILYT
jgi:hypothetical protein